MYRNYSKVRIKCNKGHESQSGRVRPLKVKETLALFATSFVCACVCKIMSSPSGRAEQHTVKKRVGKKSLFRIPISPTVFSISVVQNLCTSPLSLFQITQVGKKTLTLLMETNSIPWSKKYFRCICLNSVGNALSVGRIFSMT